MDAISFVLGIKSSHLRSSHLKDLVYRGRVMETSKPNEDTPLQPDANGHANGHANGDDDDDDDDTPGDKKAGRKDPKNAWVMAVYEDDAGDTHRWKRTITSGGSSEYRINNRIVTAPEYNAALEAENILIKARNFLVFQGDVEAIASQSSQDLTRLIEQISGSLDYKPEYERLKAEAEQAIENQNFHLTRRRAINAEIKQYQEQKAEAESFQRKLNERDDAIVDQMLWKIYHYQRIMDDSSNQIQEHNENLAEFRRNLADAETKLEEARAAQAAANKEASRVERRIRHKERDIEDEENKLIPVSEKVEQLSNDIALLKQKITSATEERDAQAARVQKAEKEIAVVEKARQQFEKQWKETLQKQGKDLSDDDRKEYHALRSQVRAKCAVELAERDHIRRQLKSDEVTVSTIKGNVDSRQAKVTKLEAELETIKERHSTCQDDVRKIGQDVDGAKKTFNQAKSERVRVNNAVTDLEEQMQDISTRLETARSGMVQSRRETRMKEVVSQMRRIYPGVHGRVGELCKPKQKKYDEAVVTALGHDFDSVVVDTEKTAAECIQYLKEQRHTPMTFIPLDNVKVSAPNTAIKSIQGARLTIDTIDFDSNLERGMAFACGGSVICDSMDVAKNIVYQKRLPVKAVTLEGFLINRSGTMTGGRMPDQKGNRGKRFAEEDVQNLERMFEKKRADLEKLPKPSHLLHHEKVLNDELVHLEQRLRSARAELQAFEKNLTSKKQEVAEEKQQLREREAKHADEAAKLAKTQSAVTKTEQAISKVEDKIFGAFCKKHGFKDVREYEAQQGSLEQQAAEKRSEFEVQLQRLKSTMSWEASRHDSTKTRVQQMERRAQQLTKDLKEYQAEKKQVEGVIAQAQRDVAKLRSDLDAMQEENSDTADNVAAARAEVQKWQREIESRHKEINGLETEVQKNSAAKFALLQRCKMEQIQIPLEEGSLDDLPNEDQLLNQDPDAMDIDEGDDGVMEVAMDDHGIEVDFERLQGELKDLPNNQGEDEERVEERLETKIAELTAELEKLNPNMRAIERLESVESKLREVDKEFEDSKKVAHRIKTDFEDVKNQRTDVFRRAFTHIQEQITEVYKELTRTEAYPLGGQAYLDIEAEGDEPPYLSGVKYHAMPPLKRFRDMEHLSGGEKTMAALALLFAIHSYQPSPFFVLDEVDAALDNANVDKIKKYIREHAGPGMQFIVISLKPGLFQDSESLVGVYRDQEVNSSKTLTLDDKQKQQNHMGRRGFAEDVKRTKGDM
ncbi:structural maintenance of chromosome 1 [Sporothrix schenckii 1099-18]|uniref:Structural maintenance of chromosomes protein n=1 Tax=Sporothrix schenckii 1099-18 TaxID=1397361 RepID=A0A0F2LV21_SPOSC|nr:structural maintenance of chromosome 1 [Sporothrix schenckii 1099-18]KJR80350.1 structural maintenance of chromosome 1 [Sporothrix schenckii 1099-18]